MARQRIGGNKKVSKNMAEEDIILASLEEKPKVASKLFDNDKIAKPASQLTQVERDYYTVAYVLKSKYLTGTPNDTNIDSIKVIANFYQKYYENVFGVKCIDYNWYHFLKVMEGVMTYFQFTNFIDLADFICKSFVRFENVSKTLNLSEKVLSLSTYRQPWILDELDKPQTKRFEGFY